MADVFTKEKRSQVMSRIKGKGNKDTELAMITIMREYHISGWRGNNPFLGNLILYFGNKRLPFLWMVVFGIVAHFMQILQKTIVNFG